MKSGKTTKNNLVSLAALFVLLLTACSRSETPNLQSGDWQEPGWFAEARQYIEDVNNATESCILDMGWDPQSITIDDVSGGVGFTSESESEQRRFREDLVVCANTEGVMDRHRAYRDFTGEEQDPYTKEWRERVYARNLDIYECLVHYGVDPDSPPEYDVWEEQYLSGGHHWIAYLGVESKDDNPDAEYFWSELEELCPQVY